jgi:predicted HicB family RNase H-like nuclease
MKSVMQHYKRNSPEELINFEARREETEINEWKSSNDPEFKQKLREQARMSFGPVSGRVSARIMVSATKESTNAAVSRKLSLNSV